MQVVKALAKQFTMAMLAIAVILVFDATSWAQCSMCRTALESSVEGQALVGGFRKGIVLLIAAPYAIFGMISIAVYRAYSAGKLPATHPELNRQKRRLRLSDASDGGNVSRIERIRGVSKPESVR
ncbi:MAG: hypothetical protein HY646_05480 [Acidobacteria bacterium]|nr:hypothetical protein [Acidobacteriota bacterium]